MAWRKAFVYGTVLLIFFCFGLLSDIHGANKAYGPSLVISEKSFDFKEVEEGSTVEHAFRLSNQGDEVLEINSVKTS